MSLLGVREKSIVDILILSLNLTSEQVPLLDFDSPKIYKINYSNWESQINESFTVTFSNSDS